MQPTLRSQPVLTFVVLVATFIVGAAQCSPNSNSPPTGTHNGGNGSGGASGSSGLGGAGNRPGAAGSGAAPAVLDAGPTPLDAAARDAPFAASDAGAAIDARPAPATDRADILLDDGWRFVKMDVPAASATQFNDAAWTPVTLPHTWNVTDGEVATYYLGPGWYRRHYTVPAQLAGRKLYLQFDAVNRVADVYVNGTHLGQHRGGNGRFRYDATRLLVVGGDNVIAVKADNTPFADVPPLVGNGVDFTHFGGIYRDVHLLATNPVHLDVLDYASSGVFALPSAVSAASARLDVRVEVVNDDALPHTIQVHVDLVDATGANIKSLTATEVLAPTATGTDTALTLGTTVASPHLWDGRADPYLYSVVVTIQENGAIRDALTEAIGFRFFSIDPDAGFALNGHSLDLHGVSRHQERQGSGWALTDKEHDEDMALIEEVGATIVRLSHYQQAQHFHDLADRRGMLLWSEIGVVHLMTASDAFNQNAAQQLRELIRQNYNHPSIVFWGLSNELNAAGAATLMTTLNALAHNEDPSRLTTLADEINGTVATPAWDTKATICDAVGFNHYSGWYGTGPASDVVPYLDGMHQLRPTRGFSLSEYGAGANLTIHSATPTVMDYSEEYQNLFHETYWKALKSRPYVWGKMVWTMFDFSSAARTASQERGVNNKGLVTRDHQTRKDAFYFYKANWSSAPLVYVTGKRFQPRTTASADVKVYANTDSVELRVNGVSLGVKTNVDHVFVWTGALTRGANAVVATGAKGGTTVTDSATLTVN